MMIFLIYITYVLSVCTREMSLMSSGYNSMLSHNVMLESIADGRGSWLNMDIYGNTIFCTYNLPFHRRTNPSSPEEARIVPVIFQHTLHTVLLCSSNWATVCISNLVSALWTVLSLKCKYHTQTTHIHIHPAQNKVVYTTHWNQDQNQLIHIYTLWDFKYKHLVHLW